ncbi:MAG: DNA primase [Clostridia bacterium]|nr:DNA primase [Clostridia bacterium]
MAKNTFSPEFMEELKARNDLIELAAGYFSLDKRGYDYWACCPFHHEKTPSFVLHANDQYYHCFGCGVSGNVVNLVMEMESLPFPDAVKFLADRAKLPMPEMNFDNERIVEQKRKKDRLLKIMLISARFYLKNLYGGRADAHLEYIANRGLSVGTVKKFGMGASLDFDSLPKLLLDEGFTKEEILESGVCSVNSSGKLFDAQANRLIIPIINSFDEVIAFGGRILHKKGDREAKYKNTRETLLFNKRKCLYNLNLLKKYKQSNALPYVIMVEGYMDAISLYQAGFCNVVASMGTSLTPEQARLVKRYSENVLISYDGDFAGQNADLRGLEILKDEHINVKVVLLPEGDDPDDVIRKYGASEYQKLLDNALPLVDYKLHSLERKYDINQTEGKRAYVQSAMSVIRESASAAEREDLLKSVRDKTGITYQSLSRDLEQLQPEQKTKSASAPVRLTKDKSDGVKKASRFLIGAVLFHQPYAENYSLNEQDFTDEVHQTVVQYIRYCRENGQKIRITDLFETFGEKCPEFNEILDLNTEERLLGEGAERYFQDSVKTVARFRLRQEIAAITQQISQEQDLSARRTLTERLTALTKELKKY